MAELTSLKLGKTMEKKLHSVGIYSAEELKELGSKEAVSRYHLEAAIRGIEIKELEPECKSELKNYFAQL